MFIGVIGPAAIGSLITLCGGFAEFQVNTMMGFGERQASIGTHQHAESAWQCVGLIFSDPLAIESDAGIVKNITTQPPVNPAKLVTRLIALVNIAVTTIILPQQ